MGERIRNAGAVAWACLGVAAVVALLAYLAYVVRVIWPPLILAGAIVFLLNPVVTRIQQRHVPRALATGIAYLAVLLGVGLVGLGVVPLAVRQYDDLAERWPELREDLYDSIDDWSEDSHDGGWFVKLPNSTDLEDFFSGDDEADADHDGVVTPDEERDRFFEQLRTARDYAVQAFHVVLIFVLAPIIAFYLLADLPRIREVARALVPEQARGDAMVLARRLSQAIGGYFRGQLGVALVVGILSSIGMLAIGLPFWLIVGMVAGIFNMIPLIGPWVGAVPGIVIAITTGGGVSKALWVAIVMAVVQQIDNHFISPLVMQRAVKLHPAVVMLALLAGGSLLGFVGLLLAVPATAVLKIVTGHLWHRFVLDQPLDEALARWEHEAAAPAVGPIEVVGDDE